MQGHQGDMESHSPLLKNIVSKKDKWTTNNHMKRCLTSYVIREKQIKTQCDTTRYLLNCESSEHC